MHDIKFIRQNPEAFDAGLARRGLTAQSANILKLDEKKRARQTELQELQKKRNEIAAKIGQAKARGEDASAVMEEAGKLKAAIAEMEKQMEERGEVEALLETLPNIPADDVPQGKDEKDNKIIREWKPDPLPNPPPHAGEGIKYREHFELGEKLGLMDFEAAAKLSGARFVVLKGALARMERALASFFLDNNIAAGYTEIAPPFMVRDNAMYGTGQLPKFEKDLFRTQSFDLEIFVKRAQEIFQDALNKKTDFLSALENDSKLNKLNQIASEASDILIKEYESGAVLDKKWLIPTAEVPLTNLVADEILDEEKLPLRFTAYTPCFRSEAGAAGKDTRGMIRQHQFSKVELVSITTPDKSKAEHERMTLQAESLLQKLGLPYRTMLLCTGDMGFSSEKTYDIEVWLPGQGAYREISSCSNCGAFQARRMKARFKSKASKGNEFVHTLNGSGLPIGRTLVAILENYQNADGSIAIPEALRPYMGMDKIPAFAGMAK